MYAGKGACFIDLRGREVGLANMRLFAGAAVHCAAFIGVQRRMLSKVPEALHLPAQVGTSRDEACVGGLGRP